MRFIKMHGIGNDYVYINGFEENIEDAPSLALEVADRHKGIGGDGLILLLPTSNGTDAHVRMRMFNADGSEAEMCGNGIRCLCKMAHDHGVSNANPMRIQTGNGVLTLEYKTENDKVTEVTVDMGKPILAAQDIPATVEGIGAADRIIDHDISDMIAGLLPMDPQWHERSGLDPKITCVSMGNPHVTLYCGDVAQVPLEWVGPVFEKLPLFPNKINVHFVQIHSGTEVTMRTWERGSGITQACGTGATAVAVSGALTGRGDRKILAHLPGGDLTLDWQNNDHVYMTGTATEVFTGQWPD